ncbi:MAG: ABC transporter ATP-binding protein [Promethearchaeota archaeon]
MALIEFSNVTKKFGTVVAVDDFSIQIADKEFLVLVGPSGCGKTTILRMLAGLETPTEGEIKIDGEIINPLTPKERDIAMVFQSYALYPHKDVYGNLAFPLQMKKEPSEDIDRRVNEIAEIVGIPELLDRKPRELSGGQRQRVALGRAIIREPRAFLMDEPLSNLDAKLRVKMRAELKKLQKTLKITTVYVTHDQVEAMTMGDRIAVLKDGLLQQLGTAEEIFYQPTNIFVAGFVGSPPMNFIEAKVIEKAGKLWLGCCGTELPMPDHLQAAVKDSDKTRFIMGIRPQSIIYEPKDIPSEYIMTVEVTVAQPRGTEIDVEISAGDDMLLAVFPSERRTFEMGQKIEVGFDPNYIYLFDPDTENSL